eukprot:TRINITY_DN1098_c0_g1_i1.p2 TRINITY_DN1098_c0_g1~~TRINITY_DN1098_c0_g1_i1.p2  ORF type:complete len:90 (+),score=17.63 TRINITY_DN1098_c0_g1_i1:133-402(+)
MWSTDYSCSHAFDQNEPRGTYCSSSTMSWITTKFDGLRMISSYSIAPPAEDSPTMINWDYCRLGEMQKDSVNSEKVRVKFDRKKKKVTD